MINSNKLHNELLAAGIEISGCDSDGRVIDKYGKEIQLKPNVLAVLEAHDPTPEPIITIDQEITDIKLQIEALNSAINP